MTEHEKSDGLIESLDDATEIGAAILLINALDCDDDSEYFANQPTAHQQRSPLRWNPQLPPLLSWVIVICMWVGFAIVLLSSSW